MTRGCGTGCIAACISGIMLATVAVSSYGSHKAAVLAGVDKVSIQVVNPEAQTAVRITLDGKLIFDGVPVRSTLGNIPTLPAVVGSFDVSPEGRHELTAEAPTSGARARLVWTPKRGGSAWLVIFYYPGRADENIPPFFTLALQDSSHKLR